ncbi:MAG: hypothetical protein KDD47_18720 [Acidobacteria bacterium]|nr:hypothetical protein [Acidobacteriota bacterium]
MGAMSQELRLPAADSGASAISTGEDRGVGAVASWVDLLAAHSLSWLFLANLVGMLLATLLLFPQLGELLGSWTYGRWATAHMDLQLYGWCSLPLVGLLLSQYFPVAGRGRGPRLALVLWSGSLWLGTAGWLSGASSGKLFLEWQGTGRGLFVANLTILAGILGFAWLREWPTRRRGRVLRGGLLLVLVPVPWILFRTTGRDLYPPINPESGGATGTSLLGSVLGIVLVFALLPAFLGVETRDGRRTEPRTWWILGALFAAHLLVFGLLGHGDRSHRELAQILGLGSVALWWPVLLRHVSRFRWPEPARPWLAAAAGWSALLILDGVAAFLPGVLDLWKFTNALVAHAHLAMAGLWTSLAVVILESLGAKVSAPPVFARASAFLAWNGGLSVMIVVLTLLGTLEGLEPGLLHRGGAVVPTVYGLRWIAGAAMLAASGHWLRKALARVPTEVPT